MGAEPMTSFVRFPKRQALPAGYDVLRETGEGAANELVRTYWWQNGDEFGGPFPTRHAARRAALKHAAPPREIKGE